MINYITKLPKDRQIKYKKEDYAFEDLIKSGELFNTLRHEVTEFKFNQFTEELFLFFHNLENYGLEFFDEIYDQFFKRLMLFWLIILPINIKLNEKIKDEFKLYINHKIKAAAAIEIIAIYKKWVNLWDLFLNENRQIFYKVFEKFVD
jgi:hypothetical protein